MRNVHWLHALTAATIIVSFGPSSSSDAKSTAYETDIVEPLRASGSVTLKTEVTDDSVSSRRNGQTDVTVLTGNSVTSSPVPTAIIPSTKSRAGSGRPFMGVNNPTRLSAKAGTGLGRVQGAHAGRSAGTLHTTSPQDGVSDSQLVPQTILPHASSVHDVPHTMVSQSAPSHAVPHTMLAASPATVVPQTMLPHSAASPLLHVVPQTVPARRPARTDVVAPAAVAHRPPDDVLPLRPCWPRPT